MQNYRSEYLAANWANKVIH